MNSDLTEQKMEQQFQAEDSAGDNSDMEKPARRSGRRKIKIEYIEDKNRRHITFSKRKAGIMKKAYELSTLTGTQVLLLVVSETGLVYTFTTVKLQPIVTKTEGKNLIQACLSASDTGTNEAVKSEAVKSKADNSASFGVTPSQVDEKKTVYEDSKTESSTFTHQQQQQQPQQLQIKQNVNSYGGNGSNYQTQPPYPNNSNNYSNYPGYMNLQPNGYSQMPQPYYNQQQPQSQNYWQSSNNPALQQRQLPTVDDKARNVSKK